MKMALGATAVALVAAVVPASALGQAGYGGPSSVTNEATTQQVTTTMAPAERSVHPTDPSSQRQTTTRTSGSGPKVRPELSKPLQEAIKLNEASDFAGAMAKIREADAAVADKTPEENFVIGKFMGSVALRLNDRATALTGFNRAVDSNAIPDAEKPNILYIAMALNAEAKNYARAVALGEQLMAIGPLDEKSSVPLAQSYFNSGSYDKALKVATDALARGVTDPANKAALLEVQTVAQARMGNQAGAEASLEQQCAEKCDGKSWGSLVQIAWSKLAGISDHQALNLLRLKLAAGGMDSDDYLTMATLDISQGLPAEAKAVLERGIAAGTISRGGRTSELLGRATPAAAADARSLPAFEHEAAAKSTGELDIKLGESYYSHGQMAQAVTALRRGLGKGGVRDVADANVTLGIVLLAQGDKAGAAAAFGAAASSSRQAPIAHLWTVYANRKG